MGRGGSEQRASSGHKLLFGPRAPRPSHSRHAEANKKDLPVATETLEEDAAAAGLGTASQDLLKQMLDIGSWPLAGNCFSRLPQPQADSMAHQMADRLATEKLSRKDRQQLLDVLEGKMKREGSSDGMAALAIAITQQVLEDVRSS